MTATKSLPARFYKAAVAVPVEGGFGLALDGRQVRTPGRAFLVVPNAELAGAVAAEWNAQAERIDHRAMPLTRYANAAIDRVAPRMDEVRAELLAFADTDLVLFRASEPDSLVERQSTAWQPTLDWMADTLKVAFVCNTSLAPQAQLPAARAALGAALAAFDPFRLLVLRALTDHTGSLFLSLAALAGRHSFDDAFARSRSDEAWQNERWGVDAEAAARTGAIAAEIADLQRFFAALAAS